jgi:DNA-directed RNA polymerase subunit RPC12/RpoP
LFVCLECGAIFEEPVYWEEKHGLDTPPYEQLSGCKVCRGSYTETYQCSGCGEWIVDDYIKINNDRYCQDCYHTYTLGEEN